MIFLTGATGFIGSNVQKYLNKCHYSILARQDIVAATKDCNILIGDISSIGIEQLKGHSTLIHLAWDGLPHYNDISHTEKYLFEHYLFIKKTVLAGIKTICVAGTCFEYGLQNGCLSEDLSTKPCTPYALAKDTLRKMLEELQKHYDFKLIWLRLWYVYGQNQSSHSILSQLQRAIDTKEEYFNMSIGDQLRDYLPVEEMAKLVVDVATHPNAQGIYNICSGSPLSIRKLVENYLSNTKQNIKLNLGFYSYPPYEPLAFWGNNKKIKQLLEDRGGGNKLTFFPIFDENIA